MLAQRAVRGVPSDWYPYRRDTQMFLTSKFSRRFWLTQQRHLLAKMGHTARTQRFSGMATSLADLARPARRQPFQGESLSLSPSPCHLVDGGARSSPGHQHGGDLDA